ncbi:MAG: hypothetical protein KDD44_06640, partial [Bdellovibrionales bacterium]|nr:hypothetical protein [Bdellovibrionales bacterium]
MFSFIAAGVCVLLGSAPLLLLVFAREVSSLSSPLVVLNAVGWWSLSLVVLLRERLATRLRRGLAALEITPTSNHLEQELDQFLYESKRLYRAFYAFRLEDEIRSRDVGVHLQRIVELTYRELRAKSAELALYDQETGLWSQVLFAGIPSSVGSQSMLVEATTEAGSKRGAVDGHIIVKPVSFAGTLFGALRIELPETQTPSPTDLKVAYLLATQAAILLVDARFTEALLRMREKSEESVRAKTGFLANLSHEIRGPLGIVLNGIELILDGLCGPTTDSQAETCRMMKTSAEHLLDLVNDVLDYAKVEAGKVRAKPVDLELQPLLSDLANVIRSQAHAKGHTVKLEPVDQTLGVHCDKRHIRQMLINLLTNAVKYTENGGTITIRAERAPGDRVKIMVSDTGVGIAESEKRKVFGAFERVDNSYALAQAGTGLGMPLTRKLAEVNGGTADFDSELGKGSTFWLLLPSADIDPERHAHDKTASEDLPPQGNGETILIVDDSQESREMLERYLVHQGFNVVQAGGGAEVLRSLRESTVQLAVVE